MFRNHALKRDKVVIIWFFFFFFFFTFFFFLCLAFGKEGGGFCFSLSQPFPKCEKKRKEMKKKKCNVSLAESNGKNNEMPPDTEY